jgi:hypothetical protein
LISRFLVLLLCAAIGASAQAATQDLQAAKFEENVTVGGTRLGLQGSGTRTLGASRLYVVGLYTPSNVRSLDDIMATPGPKRLSMTFVREIEAGPFGKLLTRGVEENVPKSEVSKLVPGLIRMGDIFTANKVMKPGEMVFIDWIPGTGMVLTAKGKVQGEPFKEPEFYKAIMSIWFGNQPADPRLKDALLGLK